MFGSGGTNRIVNGSSTLARLTVSAATDYFFDGFLDGRAHFFRGAFGHGLIGPRLPDFRSLLHAGIARVGVDLLLRSVSEIRRLRHLCNIRRGDNHSVNQFAVTVP